MQNYPLARRLMAAMIDEGKGRHANATKPGRSAFVEEDAWIGGSTPQTVREFDDVLEERVKIELQQRQLIDPEATDQVLTNLRLVRVTIDCVVRPFFATALHDNMFTLTATNATLPKQSL